MSGAIVGLIAAQALGIFGGGAPTVISPGPVPLVVLVLLGLPISLVILAFVGWYLWWCPSLYSGLPRFPMRSIVLFVTLVVLSAAAFVGGWDYGVKYQGFNYTLTCLLISLLLAAACGVAVWLARKAPSFSRSLAAQFLIFAWLVSYAFPYLGETP